MGYININDVEQGMILDNDVFAGNGRFLISAGTKLRQKHIKTCKNWGITQVDIQNRSSFNTGEKSEKISLHFLQQGREYFNSYLKATNIHHSAMRELVKLAIYKKAQQFSQGLIPEQQQIHISTETHPSSTSTDINFYKTASQLVQGQINLISLPDIYYQTVEVLQSTRSSARHIAEVVSKDSSLSAKLLKLANSAFYGFPSKIDSIPKAITIIGTKQLSSLALGISVLKAFKDIPMELLNMESFWKHSIYCGLYARLIGVRKVGLSEERLFVAGLLHDIGRLIMCLKMPQMYLQAISLSKQENIPLFKAEKSILGFTHSQVGGCLCKEWKMPANLEQSIAGHHYPDKKSNFLEQAILHLANIMALITGEGSSGETFVPVMREQAWTSIDLSNSVFEPILYQAERQFSEINNIFLDKNN